MGRASPTILQLWNSITAVNGAPTTASDGFALPKYWDDAVIIIGGTGTAPTVTGKLWVFTGGDVDQWSPLGNDPTGAGTGTLYGVINAGLAIQSFDGGNDIRYTEPVTRLSAFKRVYLEFVAETGSPTLDAWLDRTQEV